VAAGRQCDVGEAVVDDPVVVLGGAVVVGFRFVFGGGGAVVVVCRAVVGGEVAVTGAAVVRAAVVGGLAEVVGRIVVVVVPMPGAVETEGTPTPAPGAAVAWVVLTRQGRFPQAECDTVPATWRPKISPMAPAATVVATHG
jgi:hypothetical protein